MRRLQGVRGEMQDRWLDDMAEGQGLDEDKLSRLVRISNGLETYGYGLARRAGDGGYGGGRACKSVKGKWLAAVSGWSLYE